MARITAVDRPPPKSENLGEKVKAHQRYRLADRTIVPGVTTVLNVLGFNKDVLIRWARSEALNGNDPDLIKAEMAATGSLAHDLVEHSLHETTPSLGGYTPDQLERAQHSLRSFRRWRELHTFETRPLTESRLVSEGHRYGGTIDSWWGRMDGVPTLVDYKTSKAIYLEHQIQVAAYRELLRENDYPVEEVYILRIPRNEMEEFESHHIPAARLDVLWEMFTHALALYHLRKKLG